MSASTFTPTNLNPSGDLAQDVGRSDLRFGTGYFAKLSDGDRVVGTGEVVTESGLAAALSGKADNAVATAGKSGLMAASDKRKLDSLPDHAATAHGQLDGRDAAGSHPAGAIDYSPAQTVADALREILDILPGKVDHLDVANFVVRTELANGLAGKADRAYVDTALSGKADKAALDAALEGKAELTHSHPPSGVDGLEQLLETLARAEYVDAGLALKAGLETATHASSGLMSAADKTKLDELDPSGVAVATATSLGVVKPDDETIKIGSDGTLRVTSLPSGQTPANHADLAGLGAAGAHPSSAVSHGESSVAAALADLALALGGKADASHTQAIATVVNLQASLDAKANASALASYATTTALTNGLADKANASHGHALADVNNLAATLAAKADAADLASHATITALNNGLAGKANVSHSHAVSDVSGLQSGLDAKAPLASPAFTGAPTAPTAPAGAATTQLATCEFVQEALAGVGGGGGGGFTAMEVKTASGSWTAPRTGSVRVTLIGGGGGGGKGGGYYSGTPPYAQGGQAGGNSSMNGVTAYGGGGGGGNGINSTLMCGGGGAAGQATSFYMTVVAGVSYPFVVGAGGAGGSAKTTTPADANGGGQFGGIGNIQSLGGRGGRGGGRGEDSKVVYAGDSLAFVSGGDGGNNGTAYGGGGGGGVSANGGSGKPENIGLGAANGSNGAFGSITGGASGIQGGNGGDGGAGAVIIEY